MDLPGTYSLYPRSPDEKVMRDVLAGKDRGEKRPDWVIACLVSGDGAVFWFLIGEMGIITYAIYG